MLDLSKADNRHIEEVLAFQSANDGQPTVILTHDTCPMLTARRVGLECVAVPDSWLLDPEKDDRQTENEELKRQLKELQNQYPQLSVHAEND